MRRLTVVVALALLPAAVAHADGCPPTSCGTSSSAVPGSRVLALRPNGAMGPLVAYDVVTGKQLFNFGRGLLSTDGTRFFTAKPSGLDTTLTRYDARAGASRSAWTVRGRWYLGGLSPTGRWLALVNTVRKTTRLGVVDTSTGDLHPAVTLNGSNEVESVSPDGRQVFLVHWRQNGGYSLEHYDFATRKLEATKLANPTEKMYGSAWSAIATRDGRWLLTLYLKPNSAFVHALDLRSGIGHCVDLPGTSHFPDLSAYALALSPDQGILYLGNPLLGVVHEVSLRTLRVTRTAHFAPLDQSSFVFGIAPNAAVSPNGRMVVVSGGRQVWSYDTAFGRVRGPRGAGSPNAANTTHVAGLAFTPNGRRIVAVRMDHRVVSFDAATGKRL